MRQSVNRIKVRASNMKVSPQMAARHERRINLVEPFSFDGLNTKKDKLPPSSTSEQRRALNIVFLGPSNSSPSLEVRNRDIKVAERR